MRTALVIVAFAVAVHFWPDAVMAVLMIPALIFALVMIAGGGAR